MELFELIKVIKRRHALSENPYFGALAERLFARDDFVETQIQFFHAVVFFARPMAILAARLPRPELRWRILHNVVEEHGAGDFSVAHERTFLLLLKRLGVTREEIRRRALWPEVRAFNYTLMGVCSQDDPLIGAAMLGIIEDLFAGISAFLGRQLLGLEWLRPDELVHYMTHEMLDVRHANDFYELLKGPHRDSPQQAYYIEQGLELGAYSFLQMYRGLYDARGRRVMRAVSGPHSASDGWTLPDEDAQG